MIHLKYDKNGLIPVICQDVLSKQILMLAYAKKEQIEKTLQSGQAVYFSRSRQEEWIKGQTSGNTQRVVQVLVDCDLDSVIYQVEQKGPACHTGAVSCFYRQIDKEGKITEIVNE